MEKRRYVFLGMIVIDPYGTLGPVWGTAGGPKQGPNKPTICENEHSQKRYMVSGSPCPLISFINVSYSVSFVVRGQRPRRGR